MGRVLPSGPLQCEHGYARELAAAECPRCADRSNMTRVIAPPRAPQTRWHGSATTFGPLVKIAVTIALVLPPLLMGIALTYARSHPGNLFLVVPIAGFVMVDVQLLPALWEPGRRRDR